MAALSIRLESVHETPSCFHLVSAPSWRAELREFFHEPDLEVRRPFALDLEGYRLGARLLFRGHATGAAMLACGRCAELYLHEIRQPVEILLEPATGRQRPGEYRVELDPEEPGLGRYEGDEVDFSPVLLETLALEWPMQPRCSDGCRGLCPECGVNRNLATCGCGSGAAARPLAGLGSLLEQSRWSRG